MALKCTTGDAFNIEHKNQYLAFIIVYFKSENIRKYLLV